MGRRVAVPLTHVGAHIAGVHNVRPQPYVIEVGRGVAATDDEVEDGLSVERRVGPVDANDRLLRMMRRSSRLRCK